MSKYFTDIYNMKLHQNEKKISEQEEHLRFCHAVFSGFLQHRYFDKKVEECVTTGLKLINKELQRISELDRIV